jgi:hypothetical protein
VDGYETLTHTGCCTRGIPAVLRTTVDGYVTHTGTVYVEAAVPDKYQRNVPQWMDMLF